MFLNIVISVELIYKNVFIPKEEIKALNEISYSKKLMHLTEFDSKALQYIAKRTPKTGINSQHN